ncbi:MAG: signal recognition particle-docking protein FtsY [Holosporales bacterium]|jgi:fused signal recognition particle receptor|nr:signal recognition particle-docking protein FtsY [Holosporales bacterium]
MFWNRLKGALSRTSSAFTEKLSSLFSQRCSHEEKLSALEDLLIAADLGPQGAAAVIATLKKGTVLTRDFSFEDAKKALIEVLVPLLTPYERPLTSWLQLPKDQPAVFLLTGVNGNGKTTTAAKIAHFLRCQKRPVRLAACDTFRAAAVAQLCHWGQKLDISVHTAPPGSDAAALAYSAFEATGHGEILLIDTAGRLHTRADLMAELEKIQRVLKKLCPEAPHETLLVLDATTGQEALAQAEVFQGSLGLSGLIVTKLDGTAKGGIVVPLVQKYQIPLRAIGTGESLEDFSSFDAQTFVSSLVSQQ